MSWVAVDEDKAECIYEHKPKRDKMDNFWSRPMESVNLSNGSIEKLIGRKLTWKDEAVELI